MGARIEIIKMLFAGHEIRSLPSWERGLKYVGCVITDKDGEVAPLVGARIEILLNYSKATSEGSLPSWERGLK